MTALQHVTSALGNTIVKLNSKPAVLAYQVRPQLKALQFLLLKSCFHVFVLWSLLSLYVPTQLSSLHFRAGIRFGHRPVPIDSDQDVRDCRRHRVRPGLLPAPVPREAGSLDGPNVLFFLY